MENKKKFEFKLPKNIPKNLLKKDRLLIMLLFGILLAVVAWPGSQGAKNPSAGAASEAEDTKNLDQSAQRTYMDYMERHLEEALAQMQGVGDVTVMMTLKTSTEKVVEKDVQSDSETVAETDSQGGERTTGKTSRQESTVYDGTNAERQTPYVSKEVAPKVEGVVVLAAGGDNAVVAGNITEAVQALFDIDTHKIKIMKKN